MKVYKNKISRIMPLGGGYSDIKDNFNPESAKRAALAVIADQVGGSVDGDVLLSHTSLKNTRLELPEINCQVEFA